MRIRIPNKNNEEMFIEDHSIVLVGANGSGKTRMSVWIDRNNPELHIHRISAQRFLDMPRSVRPSEINTAEWDLRYGSSGYSNVAQARNHKFDGRWGGRPETHMLNDYEKLLVLLMTDMFQKSIEFREEQKRGNDRFDNETLIEKLVSIWQDVITHRKLVITAGKIEATEVNDFNSEKKYSGSDMSDGERAIFHFIGEVLCAEKDCLIIIDEPENHLHKSLLIRLWDAAEVARPDCAFLYITHDVDFASTRTNACKIWVKSMENSLTWDYEILDGQYPDDRLLLQIIGNRQKVLLVEGKPDKSYDRNLYSKLFPEYNVIALDSCSAVIQNTKAFNRNPELHYAEVKGIIDRDRRNDDQIRELKQDHIYTSNVAEIENLFLLPEIIQVVANSLQRDDGDMIISGVSEKVIEFLADNIQQQALLFTKETCYHQVMQKLNKDSPSLEEFKQVLVSISEDIDIEEISRQIVVDLQGIINRKDYIDALKVINHKGLLAFTKLSNMFDWRKDAYINHVLRLVSINNDTGRTLRETFKTYISID